MATGAIVGALNHWPHENEKRILKKINDLAGKLSNAVEIKELYETLDAWRKGDLTAMSRINDQLISHFLPPIIDTYIVRLAHAGAKSINKEATRNIKISNSTNQVVLSNGATLVGFKPGRTFDNSYNRVYVP